MVFLRSSERRGARSASAALASACGLQNIQDRRSWPAFQPDACIRCEILQPFRGNHQFGAMYAAFAAFTIAVLGNFVAECIRPQMSDLAQERNGRLGVTVFELAIRRAHAAKRLNLAAVAYRRASARLIANLAQGSFPAFAKAAFADVVPLLMGDHADAHRSVGIDRASADAAAAGIFLA